MKYNNKIKIFSTIYIILVFVFLFLPILSVVIYSFNSSESSVAWTGFTFDWYKKMLNDRRLMESFKISIRIALYSSIISIILGTIGAISANSLNKKIDFLLSGLIYIPLIVPELVLGIGMLMLFSLIPKINYGIPTLVISHTMFCIPYIYLLVRIRLNSIDKSIIEAAKDLGASSFYIFKTIILPLILPSILSGMLLCIAMSLDDVIISFFLSGPKSTTLPIKIYSMLKLGVTPEINALCTVILLFTIVILGIIFIIIKIRQKNEEDFKIMEDV